MEEEMFATQYESYEVATENDKSPDEPNRRIYVEKVPMASCIVREFSKTKSSQPYIALFDSGSSHTWWNAKSLHKGCVPE